MYLAALIFTLIGWAFQLYETLIKKTRNINIFLPAAYFIACLLFAISSFMAGDILWGILDIICTIFAVIVFVVLLTRK